MRHTHDGRTDRVRPRSLRELHRNNVDCPCRTREILMPRTLNVRVVRQIALEGGEEGGALRCERRRLKVAIPSHADGQEGRPLLQKLVMRLRISRAVLTIHEEPPAAADEAGELLSVISERQLISHRDRPVTPRLGYKYH